MKAYPVVFILQIFAVVVGAVNIALNKVVAYCSNKESANKVLDGDKSESNFEAFRDPCNKVSFLQIYLNAMFSIHYVIIYEGEEHSEGQLDYFIILLSGLTKSLRMEYPGTSSLAGKTHGLRMNCAFSTALFSNVLIESRTNVGFTITEIEIHTLASELPGDQVMIYRGCFINFGEKRSEFNLTACHGNCFKEDYLFSGIKSYKNCSCSNTINEKDEVPLDHCKLRCDDGVRWCGGEDSSSVYLIRSPLPFLVGCFRSSEEITYNAISSGNMTVEKCLHLCENKNYAYLQSGDYCICQDEVMKSDAMPLSHVACKSKCTGEDSIACGGPDLASVYKTCLPGSKSSLTCLNFMNCAGSYDKFGDCNGVCKSGFIGTHCLERIIKFEENSTKDDGTEPKDKKVFWNLLRFLPFFLPVIFLSIVILARSLCKSLTSVSSPNTGSTY